MKRGHVGAFRGGRSIKRSAPGKVVVTGGAAPTISSISPASGVEDGGIFAIVTGENFIEAGLVVKFGGAGGTSAPIVRWINTTTVHCYTPAGTAGAVDVYVSTDDGNDTLTEGYTYTASQGAPVYTGVDQTLVHQSNFDSFTSAQDVIDSGGWRVTNVSNNASSDTACQLQTDGGYSGAKYLRLAYAGTNQEGHTWSRASDAQSAKYATPSFGAFRFRVGVSGGMTFGQLVRFKFLMLVRSDDGGSRAQMHWANPNNAYNGTWAQNIGTLWQHDTDSGSSSFGDQAFQPAPYEIDDGGWHLFSWAYRTHSASEAGDGYLKGWVDGVLILHVEDSVVGVTAGGALTAWCTQTQLDNIYVNDAIARTTFGSVLTAAVSGGFNFDIDDYTHWRE